MRVGVRTCIVAAVLATAVACGGGSTPTAPDNTTPPATGHIVTGTTVNAITGGAAPGVTIASGAAALGVTGATGAFSVGFSTGGNNRITLSGPGFVTRETGIQAPSLDLRLSLIPSTGFDLAHFDQMFRHREGAGGKVLTRWTSPPALIIERRVLQFTTTEAASYTALEETLTDAEVETLVADLTEGYALLTGGLLGTFSSVTSRTSAPGTEVPIGETGAIVVTRQSELSVRALQAHGVGYWGYARWSTTTDGAVTRGFIILDRDFERGTAFVQVRRSLHMHELGHSLGCQHVSPPFKSVMNPDAQTFPNEFDRSAARIAHLRPVGNRTPDIDPTGHAATTASSASARPLWHGAH